VLNKYHSYGILYHKHEWLNRLIKQITVRLTLLTWDIVLFSVDY